MSTQPHFEAMIFPPHKLRVGDVIITAIQHEDGLTNFSFDYETTHSYTLRHHVDHVTLHGNVTREAAYHLVRLRSVGPTA